MDQHYEQFENFLREFQPRCPRALPKGGRAGSLWMPRLAAAAVITVAGGISLWFVGQRPAKHELDAAVTLPVGEVPSALTLTRQALQDPERLDGVLAASRGSHLPRFDRENSILRVLAKE